MEDHIIGLMQVIEEKFSHIASNTVYHPALQSFRWREDEALRRGILREIIVTSTRLVWRPLKESIADSLQLIPSELSMF